MFSSSCTRIASTERVVQLSLAVAIAIALSLPLWAVSRPGLLSRGASTSNPPPPAVTGLVTRDLATGGETPVSLVRALVGPNAAVSNIQYTGAPIAAGTFSGGTGIIGIESGVILSSGNIASVVGPVNQAEDTTTDNGLPGDPELDAIIGNVTRDATLLEFDVQCPNGTPLSYEYVFSSEEYSNNVLVNDVFACFLNGQNIALTPGTNLPIMIGNVNCGNPYNPPSGPNCSDYVNNDCQSLGLGFPCTNIPTEMDGLTVVLTATAMLRAGPNHIKLAIADALDGQYDANVFIRRVQDIDCSSTAPAFDGSSPCSQILNAWAGAPVSFGIQASAANGLPGEAVTLTVAGSSAPLAGGTFVPSLPAGPAQPVSTQFHWIPTPADVGLNHLDFTATDQLQQSASCGVDILVSLPAPVFEAPSPCGQVVDVAVGVPLSFDVLASATNGDPGQSVILSVTGDAIPLAGGTFVPPLPTGPAQPAASQFHWTPTPADIGLYHLDFTATDQLQQAASCGVTIRVSIQEPVFESPSPCLQVVNAPAGLPFSFRITASATNGAPGQSVTLSVTGDAVPLAGGTFVPPLPAGPAQPVSSQFDWTPTLADVGLYRLDFTATDQLLQSTSCNVTIHIWGLPGTDLCQAGVGGVIACPCSNPPAVTPGGCDNSSGTGGARLESIGIPRVEFSSVVFTTTGEKPTALSIVVQGNVSPPTGIVYGQGIRCFGGLLKRLYVKTASGGSITAPQPGDPAVYDRSAHLGDTIMPGTSRYYGVYYRDPTILGGCPVTSTFNVTQTQQILWGS